MQTVRADDLVLLATCDWVLAYIDPEDRPCGSYWELAYARALGKPIHCVVAGGVTRCPLWLLAELDIHDSFDGWAA
jgi:nucleoside 2-deoxyribosyltransferase